MARCGNGQPDPDPYQLLGVARQAAPAEIAQAWRRSGDAAPAVTGGNGDVG